MSEWFYAHNGEQKGPVSKDELANLAQAGAFNPETDLVWKEGMADWKIAAEIPELNPSSTEASTPLQTPTMAARPTTNNDPYQPPAASNYQAPSPTLSDDLPEIEPGTSPLGITECISRSFELLKRYFGIIFVAWIIFIAINFGVGVVVELIDGALAASATSNSGFDTNSFSDPNSPFFAGEHSLSPGAQLVSILINVISNVISLFLTLGMTRLALNLMSGQAAEIGMIFGEGSKLLRAFFASILYALIVFIGLLLLIVPGIYWGIKYSQYQTAIVDKDMSIWESFQYSADLTQNNKWALLGLGILTFLINLGGLIVLCIGLIFTIPLTWLAWLLAYRWLKHGQAGMEDPGLHLSGPRAY